MAANQMKAAAVIVLTFICQGILWWTTWDQGRLIAEISGDKMAPILVITRLEYAVRFGILLAVTLLAFAQPSVKPQRREAARGELFNPFA